MRLFWQDIKRGLMMWQFWLCVGLILGNNVYVMIATWDLGDIQEFYNQFGYIGTLNWWFFPHYIIPNRPYVLLITAVIAYSTMTCQEMNTGFMASLQLRLPTRRFLPARTLSTFSVSALIVVAAEVIWLIGSFIIDPHASVALSYVPGQMGVLYEKSILLYCVAYLGYDLLFVGVYALLSMGICMNWRNRFIGYALPLVLYWGRLPFFSIFLGDRVFQARYLSMEYELNFGIHIGNNFGSLAILLGVSLTLILVGYRRWRLGNW